MNLESVPLCVCSSSTLLFSASLLNNVSVVLQDTKPVRVFVCVNECLSNCSPRAWGHRRTFLYVIHSFWSHCLLSVRLISSSLMAQAMYHVLWPRCSYLTTQPDIFTIKRQLFICEKTQGVVLKSFSYVLYTHLVLPK